MAKILHLLLDWDMNASIWVASLTVAVYVTLGGLISAVFNEVVQFFLIWLGILLVPILGLIDAGGWTKLTQTHPAQHARHPSRHSTTSASPACGSNLGSFDNPDGRRLDRRWSSASACRASPTGAPTSCKCSG